ncbi:MAG: CtsR family transcriptional regulator [Clostridia bacterium]|nr:CtsR family transcriptional regulator [Clostridia bacterium]
MILSQRIARMLVEMLEEAGGELSIVRNDFAKLLGCVPSQINYVITSRFTPERGYLVESRRGGGGFIRIRKVPMGENEYLMRFYHASARPLDQETARAYLSELVSAGILSQREGRMILCALSDRALEPVSREGRDLLRSRIFQTQILELLLEKEMNV